MGPLRVSCTKYINACLLTKDIKCSPHTLNDVSFNYYSAEQQMSPNSNVGILGINIAVLNWTVINRNNLNWISCKKKVIKYADDVKWDAMREMLNAWNAPWKDLCMWALFKGGGGRRRWVLAGQKNIPVPLTCNSRDLVKQTPPSCQVCDKNQPNQRSTVFSYFEL